MDLDDHLEICLGHVDAWLASFVDQYPDLIPAGLFEKCGRPQSSFDFGSMSCSAEMLPVGDLEITLISLVEMIAMGRKKKEEGCMLDAWRYAVRASRLCGRLQPVEDYDQVLQKTDEKNLKLKIKALELFALRRPDKGWANYSQACDAIHSDLILFFETLEPKRKSPDLVLTGRFKRWGKDPMFKIGFEAQTESMQKRRLEPRSN